MLPMRGTNETVVWKNGATSGFFSYIGFVREAGIGVVVLANRKVPAGRIGMQILQALNGTGSIVEQAPQDDSDQ
jgi:CubicO group peptidase (beta-lactamase class C family)